VLIDAEICPELREGLMVAMGWIRHWFRTDHEPLIIEAKASSSMPTPRAPERAGFFFSGGIDAFATLRANRLHYPLGHPLSIKDGLLVYGLEQDDPGQFEHVLHSLSGAAKQVGITLIPVYTNVYLNYRKEDAENNFRFWEYKFMSAALSAVAHAFANRFTVVSIASSDDIPNIMPYGSHPLIDSNYSGGGMRIKLDGITLSRFAKTKLVAEWPEALEHLRVCNQFKRYQADMLNCGHCEKCLRTMLALLVLGVLDQTSAFSADDISSDLVRSAVKLDEEQYYYHEELLYPLREQGRHDLVNAIKQKLAEYHRREKIITKWMLKIKRFDSKYLKGNLRKLKKSIHP